MEPLETTENFSDKGKFKNKYRRNPVKRPDDAA